MTRRLRPITLLFLGGIALSACKKDPEPQAVPLPSTTAEAAVTAPTGTADTAATATVAATPPPPPPQQAAAPVAPAPIDACCGALAAVSRSGRGKDAKQKSAAAFKMCGGIAKLVREGKTSRASALTQIRSQLSGVDIPAQCH